jgi:ATP-dependent Zn protease
LCGLICHSNKCLNEKLCQEKVVLRCACKTLRKSLPCNEVCNEKDLKETKKTSTEQKVTLKCNEKCLAKLKKNEIKSADSIDQEKETPNDKNKNTLIYVVLAVLILLISFIFFYFIR